MRSSCSIRLALVLAMAGGALTCAAQTEPFDWGYVVAPKPNPRNRCVLARSSDELESQLRGVGWRNVTKDFPDIAWKQQKLAVIIALEDKRLKPGSVHLSPSDMLRVDFEESQSRGTGVIVLQVAPHFRSAQACYLAYADPKPAAQAVFYIASWSVSVNDARSDEPVDESERPEAKPATRLEEVHPLGPEPTLSFTTPPSTTPAGDKKK